MLGLVLVCAACSNSHTASVSQGETAATAARSSSTTFGTTESATTDTSPATTATHPDPPTASAPPTADTPTTTVVGSPDEWKNANPPVSEAPATALIDRLAVQAPDPFLADYRRTAFGRGWDYHPESGCNTRELVLIVESSPPPVMGPRCKPISGHWVSIYDGVRATDPAALEIDHLVPLSDAWRSGAAGWSDARREAFANDVTDPDTLVAVTSHSNRSKGDSSPDDWMPPASGDHCRYVEAWIRVKARWSLAVTPAEKSTLVQVLSGC
ncbi:MAG: HNH endonuclease family protein [Aquihabitans sp.]